MYGEHFYRQHIFKRKDSKIQELKNKTENTKMNFGRVISAVKFLAVFLFVASWFFLDWSGVSSLLPRLDRVQAVAINILPNAIHANDTTTDDLRGIVGDDSVSEVPDTLSAVST